jgi:hypothetical protein
MIGGIVTYTTFFSSASGVSPQSPVFAVLAQVWSSYSNRYAVIVMGGDETGQMYTYYWMDTYGMYQHLISLGFTAENIYFLAYGSDADAHPEAVDRVSTKANVQWAFDQVRFRYTTNDLVYVFWVDHGDDQLFNLHEGTTITHVEYNDCIRNIYARVIIGAYNPCYSGAVVSHISRPGVITITSQDAQNPNRCGWAGWWRTALAGGTSGDPSDKNGDGRIDMAEAYEWVAPKSQAYSYAGRPAPEHPMFDDNGDGVGSEYNTAGYNPNDPNKDGFRGKYYSLTGWRPIPAGVATTTSITKTTSTASTTVTSTTTGTSTRPTVLTESGPGTTTRTVRQTTTVSGAPRTVTRTSTYTSTWTFTETRWSYASSTLTTATTQLSVTRMSTGLTTITSGGTIYEVHFTIEYWLMRVTREILVQVFSFAQLVRHILTGPVVQVEITEYKGRYYGPLPEEASEPTLLDVLTENAPLIAALVSVAIAATLLVMWKRKINPLHAVKAIRRKSAS